MLCHKWYLRTLKLPSLTGKDKYMSTDSISFPQQLQSVMHMLTCPSLKYVCRDIPHLALTNPHTHKLNYTSAFYISRLLSQHFIFRPTYPHINFISHIIVIMIVLQTSLLICVHGKFTTLIPECVRWLPVHCFVVSNELWMVVRYCLGVWGGCQDIAFVTQHKM